VPVHVHRRLSFLSWTAQHLGILSGLLERRIGLPQALHHFFRPPLEQVEIELSNAEEQRRQRENHNIIDLPS
jgi:hypothetical protein